MKGETIQSPDPDRTSVSIKVPATNFIRAATPNQPVRKRDHMWKRPPQGLVKVNVDAAFHPDTQLGAIGAIARDDKGNFLAAANWFLPHVNNVDCAELSAIHNGLYLQQTLEVPE